MRGQYSRHGDDGFDGESCHGTGVDGSSHEGQASPSHDAGQERTKQEDADDQQEAVRQAKLKEWEARLATLDVQKKAAAEEEQRRVRREEEKQARQAAEEAERRRQEAGKRMREEEEGVEVQ